MNTLTIDQYFKVALMDLLLLAAVYFIPTLSHITTIPLYIFEPMRIMLYACLLFCPSRKNVYLMAVTMPIFSYIVAGHPVMVKNGIMSIELLINVILVYRLVDKRVNLFVVSFVSVIISKMVYYILKYFMISLGILSIPFIDTSIIIQIVVAFVLSIIFFIFYMKK